MPPSCPYRSVRRRGRRVLQGWGECNGLERACTFQSACRRVRQARRRKGPDLQKRRCHRLFLLRTMTRWVRPSLWLRPSWVLQDLSWKSETSVPHCGVRRKSTKAMMAKMMLGIQTEIMTGQPALMAKVAEMVWKRI